MAKKPVPLAKSELEIVQLVWKLGEATVREIHEALPASRDLDFWTVQTYLRRLAAKGYLRADRVGHGNVYSAIVQPRKVIGDLVNDFVDRVFGGEVLPVFQHLVNARKLTDEEITELQDRLNALKGKK
jgi:BlaI family transcriptional regulator, penicillinase repressor